MRDLIRRGGCVLLVAGVALTAGTCGSGSGSPAGPGVPTVPTPAPVPTPTPGPTPDPPLSISCSKLSPGNPNAPCDRQTPDFQEDVEDAIQTLQAQQPTIFNGDQVLSPGAYYIGLIRLLDAKGLCAETDGEELGVARNSGYNEQYDVLTWRNEVRHAPTSYQVTCTPSVVPSAHVPLPPNQPGCPLPSSREVTCSRNVAGGLYYDDVEAAITQILQDQPQLFDTTQTAKGTDWPLVKDAKAYQEGVAAILRQKGYCAVAPGEEIGVKKGTNDFNEQYDIVLSSPTAEYVRRGPATYQSTCYPASF